MNKIEIKNIARSILDLKAGVIPTDTVFGVAGLASDETVVERIYEVKGRPADKPFIVLISDIEQLPVLKINLSDNQKETLKNVWPGPVSVIFKCDSDELSYLHRGKYSLAIRLPKKEWLRELVGITGPIVATSANYCGMATPDNIEDIKEQLPGLDFYITGKVGSAPSKLAKMDQDSKLEWLARN